jgi:ABC-type lipoprotein release transport system permease subunit
MNDLIKIAWRNLWRNKRRTFITASSIFFAIWFAIVMRSFQIGTYGHMIHQVIESYSGYLQVQNADYYDDPTLDNAFFPTPETMATIRHTPNVKVAVPRIESFALASTGNLTKGVVVAGISTEEERSMTNPEQKLVRYRITEQVLERMKTEKGFDAKTQEALSLLKNTSYSSIENLMTDLDINDAENPALKALLRYSFVPSKYLTKNDEGILISDRLSKFLKAGIGDTVVLMGQGYQGVSAANLYAIRGIVKIPSIDLDNKLIYMTIDQASTLFSLDGRITSVNINLQNVDNMKETQKLLREKISDESVTIRNWEEVVPTLKQQIEGDSQSGQVMIAVLYIIIFFGIYGTVQMMISERKREFGVMVAIGMKRSKLAGIVSLEMIFLGLLGIVSGVLAAVPVILYGYYYPLRMTGEIAQMYMDYGFDPLMPLALFESYFFAQGIVVFIMVLFATLLPIKNILRINIIQSIHG